ncbi:hypothetical protein SVIOM74S_08570 [Streptomyces violarus]
MTTTLADEFETHRPRLCPARLPAAGLRGGGGGRGPGRVSALQRRLRRIEHPAAWLAKVVTNLCLNRLTSARARPTYVGTWLPEPVVTAEGALGTLESAEQRDSVSMAMLVLLERLTPAEPAVYVLREAFGYGHREIAGVLDLSEANCRQLYRRAVRRVGEPHARFEAASERQEELVTSFITAARDGDLAGLEKLLAADATWWSDGGGKVTAARWPIEGGSKLARFLAGGGPKFAAGLEFTVTEVNGATGLASWAGDTLVGLAAFEVRDGLVAVRARGQPGEAGVRAASAHPAQGCRAGSRGRGVAGSPGRRRGGGRRSRGRGSSGAGHRAGLARGAVVGCGRGSQGGVAERPAGRGSSARTPGAVAERRRGHGSSARTPGAPWAQGAERQAVADRQAGRGARRGTTVATGTRRGTPDAVADRRAGRRARSRIAGRDAGRGRGSPGGTPGAVEEHRAGMSHPAGAVRSQLQRGAPSGSVGVPKGLTA